MNRLPPHPHDDLNFVSISGTTSGKTSTSIDGATLAIRIRCQYIGPGGAKSRTLLECYAHGDPSDIAVLSSMLEGRRVAINAIGSLRAGGCIDCAKIEFCGLTWKHGYEIHPPPCNLP